MEEFTPCAVCSRTPLVGESVNLLGEDGAETLVCDLCLQRPRARALGEPLRRERVRSSEGAATVTRAWPRPGKPAVREPVAG